RPLAEKGVLDRDGCTGEVEPAGLGQLCAGLERPRRGKQPGNVGDGEKGVDKEDRWLTGVDDRGYVCDRGLPILDLEEVPHGAVGSALACAVHGNRQIAVTLKRQLDQPGHLDLTPRRGDKGPRTLDPDDGAIADEKVKRRPDHRPRNL